MVEDVEEDCGKRGVDGSNLGDRKPCFKWASIESFQDDREDIVATGVFLAVLVWTSCTKGFDGAATGGTLTQGRDFGAWISYSGRSQNSILTFSFFSGSRLKFRCLESSDRRHEDKIVKVEKS